MPQIITGDETWAHPYELEMRRQLVEGHHLQSPRKKNFKTTPTARKVVITIFWDIDGMILVGVMARGEIINLDAYI